MTVDRKDIHIQDENLRLSRFSNLNTTTVNQVLGLPGLFSTFTAPQLKKLRIIAITASVASILACIAGLYLLMSIDRRRKVFRHHLILFLLVCDFLKAIVLLIYPVVILSHKKIYGYPGFYNTVGWLTAYAIEGADIAIFIFAIHFAILIFRPNWKWRNSSTGNMEGGFYRWRKVMYPLTGLLPTVLASLAFIDFQSYNEYVLKADTNVILDNNDHHFKFQAKLGGYKPLSAWCYLPPYPLWYKLVLSWGPRYFIFLTICTLYVSIYIFVTRESRKIKAQLRGFNHHKGRKDRVFQRNDSINATLHYVEGITMGMKYFFMKILSLLGSFFFFKIYDDSDESSDGLYIVRSKQRAGTPGFSAGNDMDSDLSSRFNFVPDDVDIEDGYISDDNNGLHLFNYNTEMYAERFAQQDAEKHRVALSADSVIVKPKKVMIRQPRQRPASRVLKHESSLSNSRRSTILSGVNTLPSRFSLSDSPQKSTHLLNERTSDLGMLDAANKRSSYGNDLLYNSSNSQHNNRESVLANNSLGSHDIMNNQSLQPLENSFIETDIEKMERAPERDVNGIKHSFQSEMYDHFKNRRDQIRRQLKSIFIYPLAYMFLWLFPFIVDCSQYNYEVINGPIVWLAYIATFMQPLNGVVDVAVFVFRELPWRYSWASIQTKEIVNKYRLKGEIGERDIMEMCEGALGKNGWYYRGRWLREECWKHKPSVWKRMCWYIYRFLLGLWRNDFSYEDHCMNRAYWDNYYGKSSSNTVLISTTNKVSSLTKQSVSSSSDTENDLDSYRRKVKIPVLWRILHRFPLQEGIDLDELDRYLRLRNKYDDFVIPGLQLAIENNRKNTLFKPNYSLVGTDADNGTSSERSASKQSSITPTHVINSLDIGNITNMSFGDVAIRSPLPGISSFMDDSAKSKKEDELDLISFLKSADMGKK